LLNIEVVYCPGPGRCDRVQLRLPAGATVADALAASGLAERHGLPAVVRVGVLGYTSMALLLWLSFAAGFGSLPLLLVLVFLSLGCLGLVVPTTAVLALENHGAVAGTASALQGTLQFVVGAAVMGMVSVFVDGTAWPMVCGIAGCALTAAVLTWGTLGRRDAVPATS